jgi:tetratricopeptide (TPR) repeat protein
MQTMEQVLALDGDNAEALNFVAYGLAMDNHDLEKALAYAERAISLKRAPHILDTLGWVYYRLGRLSDALKVISEASSQLPKDPVVMEHLGDVHLAMKNLQKARAAYGKALELQPDNAELRDKLKRLGDQP